jgi:hypothetical protein
MSYRLRKKSLAREVHRVVREELEETLKELLTVNDQARSTAVHEARKHLKKVRALIRLLRPATGEAFYKLENAAMRKAAERMSSIRDSHDPGADDRKADGQVWQAPDTGGVCSHPNRNGCSSTPSD